MKQQKIVTFTAKAVANQKEVDLSIYNNDGWFAKSITSTVHASNAQGSSNSGIDTVVVVVLLEKG